MSSLKINGQEYNDIQLVKLQKGKTDEAIQKLNTGSQGADDVVFKVGEDVFVASGRDLFDGKKTSGKPFKSGEGITVELDGKKAEVIAWDNQANSGQECAKWAVTHTAYVPLFTFNAARLLLKLPVMWGAAIGAVTYAGSLVGAYIYGDSRKMDASDLTKLGTVIQKNTQAQGGWGDAIKKKDGK